MDTIASYTLRIGVLTSVTFILVGVVLLFVRGGIPGYSLSQVANFNNSSLNSRLIMLTFSAIGKGLVELNGFYFIALGLWILIFTPISVVVISILIFLDEKNRLYMALAIIVLFNLFFAILVIPHLV